MAVPSKDKSTLQNSAMSKNVKRTTSMLVTVSFAFIILTVPAEGFMVYAETHSGLLYYTSTWNAVATNLKFMNHAINFIFYVISAKKFRTELMCMFCRGRRIEPEESVNTVTSH